MKTLCSAVINSPKFCCSRYGFTCASLAQSPSRSGLLHLAISVFQEVSVNSFPVKPFLMAIQAVTGFPVLVRPVIGFVTSLLVLVHSNSHFVLVLDT